MRFFHVLPIFSLFFGARASSLDSRRPDVHPLDARDVQDVCAFLNRELVVPNKAGTLTHAGRLDYCLCLSMIPSFLKGNQVGRTAVEIGGEQAASDALTNLIITGAPSNCNYPDNSTPACVNGSPCGFTCSDGYTAVPPANPTTCACSAPNVICNGNCVAPGACPSSQPVTPYKRRWLGSGSCTEKGPGWAACGVFGGGARSWECVHTARDLESCGGCVLPLTPYSPIGKDCTSIPGVADVSCQSGECIVHRCMPGYVLSRDGTSCISTQAHISWPHVALPKNDYEYTQAMRYGLEHRPL
ncbi:hypothetical protein EI94DRAFT_1812253 [Lactarius quietus]|nr:hypothetical protein EI94DRAFT_1812253 [Lactarius quietus]